MLKSFLADKFVKTNFFKKSCFLFATKASQLHHQKQMHFEHLLWCWENPVLIADKFDLTTSEPCLIYWQTCFHMPAAQAD